MFGTPDDEPRCEPPMGGRADCKSTRPGGTYRKAAEMRKWKLLGAVSASLVACGLFAQAASTQNPAAPYILEPGVNESFRGGAGIFTARVFCGDWKAIVEFTAGIGGQRVYTKTIYVCETRRTVRVRFTIRPSQLSQFGRYQYRLKVGRHDNSGRVTRWTHSITGNFRLS